ncbi:MAG: response regulator, partial [Burkholderiales bacterium]|nr:response regulator [Burkholderiales bacterium]
PLLYARLRVVVAAPADFALAPYRHEARTTLAATAALVLLTLAAAAAIQWQMTRLARARSDSHRDKATLDRALGAMADGFLLCDAEDRIVAWNERYLEMFPWLRPAVAAGVPFERLVEIAAQALYPVDPLGRQRGAYAEQRLRQHRSGYATREQELSGGIVIHSIERRTPDGGIVGVFRDITRSERELAAAKEAAEAANAAKSQFLATMSHEMRTPLNGVLGMNALLRRTPLNEAQREYAATIESCGQALLVLIDDILDLSKIEAGRMELESLAFDPLRLVQDSVAALRARSLEKGLTLELQAPAAAPSLLAGDVNRLRQVIFNLLGNAIKFTEQGCVTVALAFGAGADGRTEFRLEVVDTGIGIAPEVLPRLFERFSQADGSTARRFGGSGLGLAISRKLVELMGGTISVASELGVGSRFGLRVPLDVVDAAQRPPDAAAPWAPTADAATPLRILVAEDNEVNQLVIAAMLDHLGHEHVVVGDGVRALERARDEDWDCILMDAQMPQMDGEMAARAIRDLPGARGRVAIIALTANVMAQNLRAYDAAGMDDCVAKPVSHATLAAALARCCPRDAQDARGGADAVPARRAGGEHRSSR